MESLQYYKDLLLSVKFELKRYRMAAALLASLVLLAFVMLALKWPKAYVSSAVIVKDVTNVIEPLLRGAAEVAGSDKTEKTVDLIFSRRLLEHSLSNVDPLFEKKTPEEKEHALRILRSGLAVDARKNTTRVSYRASDADQAYNTLQAVVDSFVKDRAHEKQKDSYEAHEFISQQVIKYKDRLELAEQRLKDFKARSVDANEGTVKRRISDLNAQIENLRIAINESEEKIRTTTQQLQQESLYESARTKVQALDERRQSLVSELDKLRLNYQDSYPDIVTLKSQIAEINADIRRQLGGSSFKSSNPSSDLPLFEELRKQLSATKVDLKTQQRRLAALRSLRKKEHGLADEVAENQAELMDLTRDYDVTKTHYEEMLSRKENAVLTLELNDKGQGETYKVSEPPFFPLAPAGKIRALYIFLFAPIAALMAPIGMALIFVLLDPRIRSQLALRSHLPENIELLAGIPHNRTRLSSRLLRKDMWLLGLMAVLLIGLYVYTYQTYKFDL